MKAANWRVDVIGGTQVRLVLWNEHWTQEFDPSDEALGEMMDSLRRASAVTGKGVCWYGAAS